MKMKTILFGVAAGCLALAASAFDLDEKNAVRAAVGKVAAQLKTATALDGKAVTLFPVRGDDAGFAEELLIGAMVGAGKTCVTSNDENDRRFREILKNLEWNERRRDLKAFDPATLDELGKLKAAQILVEATLELGRSAPDRKGRTSPAAGIRILAYAIETKQYVWSADVPVEFPGQAPRPALPAVFKRPASAPLNVAVSATGDARGSAVAAQLKSAADTEIASRGLGIVGGKDAPDVVVALAASASEFSKTGPFVVMEGSVRASARVEGAEQRLLGERAFSAKGSRSLGEAAAVQSLAGALDIQVRAWLNEVLKAGQLDVEGVEFTLDLGDAAESAADMAAAEAVRKAVAGMEGVRRATLAAQDTAKGTFTFQAVYERSRYPGGFLNAAYTRHAALFKPFEVR